MFIMNEIQLCCIPFIYDGHHKWITKFTPQHVYFLKKGYFGDFDRPQFNVCHCEIAIRKVDTYSSTVSKLLAYQHHT